MLSKFLLLIVPEKKKTVHSVWYLNSILETDPCRHAIGHRIQFLSRNLPCGDHRAAPLSCGWQRGEGGALRLLCLGSGLGKLLRQLLFVACNAVSSYSTANSLPPPSRPQKGWKKEKLLHLTLLTHVSMGGGSFSVLPPHTVDSRMPAWSHLLSVEPGLSQHCANILLLIQIDYMFQEEIKWKLQKR